ncbi:ribose 5-phosphate isomerase A [Mucilaginibacter rubeus]|uniref:ribose-5-phosphate isomerase A n=1 Tax=Mucilaginibacter rubeus TaxID=2027860 RepID=UPI0033938F5D
MNNFKRRSADEAFGLIVPGQVIGLGDGSTVLYLAELIAADQQLAASLTLTSSSARTILKMQELSLASIPLSSLKAVDLYFDGCDQFDRELNALKSGSGIHAVEKLLAGMAAEFILIGDLEKYSPAFTSAFPVVAEVLPAALCSVTEKLTMEFPLAVFTTRAALSERENALLEIKFTEWPDPARLNTFIKMLPGVLDHSLFYRMARRAFISGPEGTRTVYPAIQNYDHVSKKGY